MVKLIVFVWTKGYCRRYLTSHWNPHMGRGRGRGRLHINVAGVLVGNQTILLEISLKTFLYI